MPGKESLYLSSMRRIGHSYYGQKEKWQRKMFGEICIPNRTNFRLAGATAREQRRQEPRRQADGIETTPLRNETFNGKTCAGYPLRYMVAKED